MRRMLPPSPLSTVEELWGLMVIQALALPAPVHWGWGWVRVNQLIQEQHSHRSSVGRTALGPG